VQDSCTMGSPVPPTCVVTIQQSGPSQHSPPQLQYPLSQHVAGAEKFVLTSAGHDASSTQVLRVTGLAHRPPLPRTRPRQQGLPGFRFCPDLAQEFLFSSFDLFLSWPRWRRLR
jgi:hypothetical protein